MRHQQLVHDNERKCKEATSVEEHFNRAYAQVLVSELLLVDPANFVAVDARIQQAWNVVHPEATPVRGEVVQLPVRAPRENRVPAVTA